MMIEPGERDAAVVVADRDDERMRAPATATSFAATKYG